MVNFNFWNKELNIVNNSFKGNSYGSYQSSFAPITNGKQIIVIKYIVNNIY